MSQARVHVSTFAARKGAVIVCEVDREPILKGQPYRWFFVGFRSKYKHVRCMKASHTPRASDLESSKVSSAYAAIESAEDNLAALRNGTPEDNADSINSALNDAAEDVRAVAEEYGEAMSAMGSAGEGGDMEERKDTLETAADELDQFGVSESEPDFDNCEYPAHDRPEPHDSTSSGPLERGSADCDSCVEIKQQWWDDMLTEADEALSNLEMP